MIRQRGNGKKWHYQFVKDGKLYSGVCEGCDNKRDAEKYEKRMRERQAGFAEQKSIDRLMERRRQEITGREGITLAAAFDESLKKPHRRVAGGRVVAQKRRAWQDFVAFMAEKPPEKTDLAALADEAWLRCASQYEAAQLRSHCGQKKILNRAAAVVNGCGKRYIKRHALSSRRDSLG